ncbi:tRNA (adenine(22)-N(1))-methyltransferase [Bacillus horti]|uniref:tRNA (Adenine22-N1)-methyltransferase n=1 Tax=Caldalkalibacillus horti TaxID=77523 RepID=A0ABT9W493_9BACI|nr:class I SAM-dependent methyltransferase [Bacillus horti]MDQ0168067.1 tRNA (adenine22-N1)-methyltransferase [Bacillus horti]
MNEHHLSKRLAEVASLVPPGSRLADIGSDHAYLPVHLLIQGKICTAVAGEINPGPLESAKNQVEKLGLQGVVDVRLGDGLEVIHQDEIDVICIAGMGGSLISQILSEGKEKLHKVKRLILQPNVAGHLVREWLLNEGWELLYENMIKEDQKYYEVLMAERGNAEAPYQSYATQRDRKRAVLMGPFLSQDPNEAFREKWEQEVDKRNKILESLAHSEGIDKQDKIDKVKDEMALIEEGLKQ